MSSVFSTGFGVYKKDKVSFIVVTVANALAFRNATRREFK
jgi:hypothetical protein